MTDEKAKVLISHLTAPMIDEVLTAFPDVSREIVEAAIRAASVQHGQFGSARLRIELAGDHAFEWDFPGHCPTCGQEVRFRDEPLEERL